MQRARLSKWHETSIEQMKKLVQSSTVTLSFEEVLKIQDHTFGTLNLHRNRETRSFGEILANEIKVAIIEKNPKRFQKGKSFIPRFHKRKRNCKLLSKYFLCHLFF